VEIQLTEKQYQELITEQAWEYVLKKKIKALVKRLQNPTALDFQILSRLSKEKFEKALSFIPDSYKKNKDAPTLYPIPTFLGLPKYINSCYGFRTATGTNRMHSGIDIDTTGVSNNQPIISACAGVITKASDGEGDCGGFIKLQCNNGDAVGYCHLRVVNENLYGLKVPKGFPIGITGGAKYDPGAGNSGGPHLHYITWRGEDKINPINMIEDGGTIPAGGRENRAGKFCDPNAKG